LKGTSTYGLYLDGKGRDVTYEVYTDASFASQPKERKSVTGYVIQMAGTSVSWCSCKQGGVSLSTAEAELIALSEGAKESEWLWHLLSEMGFPQKVPVQVWCDINAAISIVKNPGNHKANKHIEIRFLFTRDLVELGRLMIAYCATQEMTADILTKALPTKQFLKLREKLAKTDTGARQLQHFLDKAGLVDAGLYRQPRVQIAATKTAYSIHIFTLQQTVRRGPLRSIGSTSPEAYEISAGIGDGGGTVSLGPPSSAARTTFAAGDTAR
ncbi:RxLR effector protein, partial [Phytophthora megakarya]